MRTARLSSSARARTGHRRRTDQVAVRLRRPSHPSNLARPVGTAASPGRLAAPHRVQQELRPRRDLHHRGRGRRDRGASQPPRRDRSGAAQAAPDPHRPRSSTRSTRPCGTPTRNCWWRRPSRPGCGGAKLTELRAADIDVANRLLTVSRAVIAVSRKHHPAGARFWVKNYSKDKEYRQLRMSGQIVRKLSAHLAAHDLGADDLLSARRGHSRLDRTRPGRAAVPARHHDRPRAGPVAVRSLPPRRRFLPGQAGRNGHDRPAKVQAVDGDPHINASTFRTSVLRPALRAAGIDGVTFHGLRHAHASSLLADGADLQVVKERDQDWHPGGPGCARVQFFGMSKFSCACCREIQRMGPRLVRGACHPPILADTSRLRSVACRTAGSCSLPD
jgi:hypothetical protein